MKKLIFIAIIASTIACNKEKGKTNLKEKAAEEQADILTRNGIDSVLAQFNKVAYADLPKPYLDYTDPDRKFEKELKSRFFYEIEGDEIYTKVIGNYLVKDFLAHDKYYYDNINNPKDSVIQYWLIDQEVLYMMLELIHRLDEGGNDMYAFHIRNSHRHPTKNTEGNGAKYSQHMFGRAIDIGVDDVDKSGKSTKKDKMIIYDLLQEIVSNDGGLGLYPGTMSLHFDCRGFKARWDFP